MRCVEDVLHPETRSLQSLYLFVRRVVRRLECTNYRGISLLSVVGEVFARVLYDRVKGLTEGSVMDEQGGFRSGRGCLDQIFAVKQVIEKMIEKDKVLFMVFIDLEKAYDNVCREKLWRTLFDYGIRGRLLRSIKALYEGGRARVKVEGWSRSGLGCAKEQGKDVHCHHGFVMFLWIMW